jgi:hypothetical protein
LCVVAALAFLGLLFASSVFAQNFVIRRRRIVDLAARRGEILEKIRGFGTPTMRPVRLLSPGVVAFTLTLTIGWSSAASAAVGGGPLARHHSVTHTPPPPVSHTPPCTAERSATGNVQVNCTRSDSPISANFQLDQSEPSVVAIRNKVVAAFNDGYETLLNPRSLLGYSVSHDGGVRWIDQGGVPSVPTVQPLSDPSLAVDDQGNVWLAAIATDRTVFPPIYKLGLWEMPAGSDAFHLVSTPVIAPHPGFAFIPDKELLAIGRDAQGREHFYIAYTQYNGSLIQGPLVLLDSTDGVSWRATTVTETLCEPASPDATPVPDGATVYVFFHDLEHAACANDPHVDPTITSGRQEVIAVDVATASVKLRTTVAAIHAVGERVDLNCGGPQVIQTAPGLEGRNISAGAVTLGPDGVLYELWPDRPRGLGGGFDNATRIFLSYSRDQGRTWSAPHVISGPLSNTHMADRFQPALTSDAQGLHAIWYERVAASSGGPDLIRTDRADLTLASATTVPSLVDGGERALSTTPWEFLPASETGCYAGDYNQVFSNGVKAFATWTDLRNSAPTAQGGTAPESDVFSDSWVVRGGS